MAKPILRDAAIHGPATRRGWRDRAGIAAHPDTNGRREYPPPALNSVAYADASSSSEWPDTTPRNASKNDGKNVDFFRSEVQPMRQSPWMLPTTGRFMGQHFQIVLVEADRLAGAEIQDRAAVGFPVVSVEAEHGRRGS